MSESNFKSTMEALFHGMDNGDFIQDGGGRGESDIKDTIILPLVDVLFP